MKMAMIFCLLFFLYLPASHALSSGYRISNRTEEALTDGWILRKYETKPTRTAVLFLEEAVTSEVLGEEGDVDRIHLAPLSANQICISLYCKNTDLLSVASNWERTSSIYEGHAIRHVINFNLSDDTRDAIIEQMPLLVSYLQNNTHIPHAVLDSVPEVVSEFLFVEPIVQPEQFEPSHENDYDDFDDKDSWDSDEDDSFEDNEFDQMATSAAAA